MTGLLASLLMIMLILDPKTGFSGAADAIHMCIQTVIPSLLPFIILSGIVTTSFVGTNPTFLKPIGRLCGIPSGGESLLLIGLIGGYPIGAQCIHKSYESGQISEADAQRMLGFCNNAGPSFIFGITASLFDSVYYAWIIWGIQILSAVLTGAILPCKSRDKCTSVTSSTPTIMRTVETSAKTMGIICTWIIAAKVILSYTEKLLAPLISKEILIPIAGLVELSNGCICLREINSPQLRFIYAAVLLTFGGICVWLQIFSVTGKLNRRIFCMGKLLQSVITIIISTGLSLFLFQERVISIKHFSLILLPALVISVLIIKKTVALQKKVLYNVSNNSRKELYYALS